MRTVYGTKQTASEIKIAELREACNAAITGGIDVETSQGTEHFSLTKIFWGKNGGNLNYARGFVK